MKIGGRAGIASLDLLESALARPYHGYYSLLPEKAAALLHALVHNHPFVDGNKRTAWLLTNVMIENSGRTLDLRVEDRPDDFMVDVASHRIEMEGIAAWLAARLVRR